LKERIMEFFKAHPYAIIGCTIGVLAAVFMMLAGFWGTLLILLLGGFGLWLGASKDKGRDALESLYRLARRVKDIFSVLTKR
jgi:uncharacterized membrane protein